LAEPVVSVFPAEEWARRQRLFDALERALSVRIRPGLSPSAVATIRFGPSAADAEGGAGGRPSLELPADLPRWSVEETAVSFSASDDVDPALQGRTLAHLHAAHATIEPDRRGEVLAEVRSQPVWARSSGVFRTAFALPELAGDESLWTLISSRRFMPLVPLVEFLRRVHPAPWQLPSLRASLLFDDPNLHALSYGFVDYRAVLAQARALGYHVAFAMVPLDGWYASRAAARLFSENAGFLSLLIHGNDHVRRELATTDREAAIRLVAQALRRIERFERQTGVHVARVVAPPHGACSREAAEAMSLFDIDALCVSRPNPWRQAGSDDPVAGFDPADRVAEGLTVIPRVHLRSPRDLLVLRAFLRHPIILYGHHEDLRGGLAPLAEAAEFIESLGAVTWMPPDRIAATSFAVRRDAATLSVRPFARNITIDLPRGVEAVVIDDAFSQNGIAITGGEWADGAVVDITTPILGVRIGHSPRDVAAIRAPRRSPWPYVRRVLVETRDRVAPVARR
jgi:hypothetical protein